MRLRDPSPAPVGTSRAKGHPAVFFQVFVFTHVVPRTGFGFRGTLLIMPGADMAGQISAQQALRYTGIAGWQFPIG